MSVAITCAPSRANAIAVARPIPAAAAVTKARLPFSRSVIQFIPVFSFAVIARLDPAIHPFRRRMDARVKPAHDVRR
jgi:hypothetical protein